MKTQSKGIIRKHPKTAIAIAAGALAVGATALALWRRNHGGKQMAKASRGGRMTAAKKRASKSAGGKGHVKNRPAGRKIMKS